MIFIPPTHDRLMVYGGTKQKYFLCNNLFAFLIQIFFQTHRFSYIGIFNLVTGISLNSQKSWRPSEMKGLLEGSVKNHYLMMPLVLSLMEFCAATETAAAEATIKWQPHIVPNMYNRCVQQIKGISLGSEFERRRAASFLIHCSQVGMALSCLSYSILDCFHRQL